MRNYGLSAKQVAFFTAHDAVGPQVTPLDDALPAPYTTPVERQLITRVGVYEKVVGGAIEHRSAQGQDDIPALGSTAHGHSLETRGPGRLKSPPMTSAPTMTPARGVK
jgi:hypothetical protein